MAIHSEGEILDRVMKKNIARRGREKFLPRFVLAGVAALALSWSGGVAFAQSKAKQPAKSASKKPAKSTGKKKTAARNSRGRGQAVPAADRIREIQSALAHAGHYSGQPNGKWDATTITAMRNFQQAKGLRASGKLDAASLQKLGLGSPIAGVAAPRTTAANSPSNK